MASERIEQLKQLVEDDQRRRKLYRNLVIRDVVHTVNSVELGVVVLALKRALEAHSGETTFDEAVLNFEPKSEDAAYLFRQLFLLMKG